MGQPPGTFMAFDVAHYVTPEDFEFDRSAFMRVNGKRWEDVGVGEPPEVGFVYAMVCTFIDEQGSPWFKLVRLPI